MQLARAGCSVHSNGAFGNPAYLSVSARTLPLVLRLYPPNCVGPSFVRLGQTSDGHSRQVLRQCTCDALDGRLAAVGQAIKKLDALDPGTAAAGDSGTPIKSIKQLLLRLQSHSAPWFKDGTSPPFLQPQRLIDAISGRSSFYFYLSLLLAWLDEEGFCSSGDMSEAVQGVSQALQGGTAESMSLRQPLVKLQQSLYKIADDIPAGHSRDRSSSSSGGDWYSSYSGAEDESEDDDAWPRDHAGRLASLLREAVAYVDAAEAGNLPQHLLEEGSLGLPILIAEASGTLAALLSYRMPTIFWTPIVAEFIMPQLLPDCADSDEEYFRAMVHTKVYAFVLKVYFGSSREILLNESVVSFKDVGNGFGASNSASFATPEPGGRVSLPTMRG